MTSLESSIHHLQAFLVTTAAFAGVVAYDTFYCLIDEVQYIYINEAKELWKKGKLPSLPNILLINARLLAIPMVTMQLAIISPIISSQDRMRCFNALSYLGILVIFNAIAIFVIRVLAIRASRLPMRIFLWTVSIGIAAMYTYNIVVADYGNAFFTIIPKVQTATEQEEMYTLWRNWTITVSLVAAFDTIVFGLTLATRFSAGNFIKSQSKVSEQFYFDSLQGFAITCSVSILDLIWIARNRHNGIYMAIIVPVQIFLGLTVAPRILRSLKIQAAKEKFASLNSKGALNLHPMSSKSCLSPEVSPASKMIDLPHEQSEGVIFHHTVIIDKSPPAV